MGDISPVISETSDGIGILTLNAPPLNLLTDELLQDLRSAFEALEQDDTIALIILRAIGPNFSTGTDLSIPSAQNDTQVLRSICLVIENSFKPVLALLQGQVVGAGLELALAAHYRIGGIKTRLSFPEVRLGLMPSAGGTQRLPRILGAGPALEMMLTGKKLVALSAFRFGLLDRVSEGDLRVDGLKYALELKRSGAKRRPTAARTEGSEDPARTWGALQKHGEAVERLQKVLIAPRKIVHCVEASQMLPFEHGLTLEAEEYQDCVRSEEASALRYFFFAEKAAMVSPFTNEVPRKTKVIGVVGAGQLGGRIIQRLLAYGFVVCMVERNAFTHMSGLSRIKQELDRLVEEGKLSERARKDRLDRLQSGTDMKALGEVDLVIEAVTEDFDIKSEVLHELGRVTREGAILATTTSYLDIEALSPKSGRPEATIGLHFFSSDVAAELLEVVPCRSTFRDVTATAFVFSKAIGMVPVLASAGEGFIANRVLDALIKASEYLLEDGANPGEIDGALRDFGFPSGPFQMLDRIGLDVVQSRRRRQASSQDPEERYVDITDRICARGWFGERNGHGYYRYPDGKNVSVECEEVAALIDLAREEKGIFARPISETEIVERCVLAMINEGARLVGEQVARRPSDVDTALVNGLGFPRWLGGPMYQADLTGPKELSEKLDMLAVDVPEFWSPAALILQLADEGRNFAGLNV